jgi:hypothetical protein
LDVDLGSFVLALGFPLKLQNPCIEIAWNKRYAGVREKVFRTKKCCISAITMTVFPKVCTASLERTISIYHLNVCNVEEENTCNCSKVTCKLISLMIYMQRLYVSCLPMWSLSWDIVIDGYPMGWWEEYTHNTKTLLLKNGVVQAAFKRQWRSL